MDLVFKIRTPKWSLKKTGGQVKKGAESFCSPLPVANYPAIPTEQV